MAYAEQDDRGEHGGQPEDGQQGGEPRTPQVEVGQRRPQQPGEESEQPRQHEQRTVAVDRRQRREEVLPAVDRLVDERGQRLASRDEGRVTHRPQAQGAAEQEEHEGEDEHRRDERPAECPAQVCHGHGDDGTGHADDEERPPGEGGRETAQGHPRQQQDEDQVDDGMAVRQQVAGPGAGPGVDVTHRRLQQQQAAEVLAGGEVQDGKTPGLGDPAGALGVEHDREASHLGREGRRAAQQVGEGGVLATHQEEQAAVGRDHRGPTAGRHDAGVPEVGTADGIERQVAVGPGRGGRPADEGHVELVEHGPDGDGRGHRHRVLEDLVTAPGGALVVDDEGGVAAAGVEVLPDQQGGLPRRGHHLGRGAPVDVAQVVTGDVFTQGVEGEVALRDRVGRDTLEVAEQTRAERVQRHHRRAHQHLAHGRPHHVAREDADRVTTTRGRRPDTDDAAPLGADGERLLVHSPGRQRADAVAVRRRADRDLQRGGQQPPGGDVAHHDAGRDRVPGGDPLRLEPQVHVDRGPSQQERRREHEQQQAGGRQHGHLPPAHEGGEVGRTHPDAEDQPARGADDRQQLLDALHQQIRPPGPWAARRSRGDAR